MGSGMRRLFAPHEGLFRAESKKFDWKLATNAKTVRDFDEAITRRSFGFPTVDAYYEASGSFRRIPGVQVPLICVQAEDDPIAVKEAIPYEAIRRNENVLLLTTKSGGHLGWVAMGEGGATGAQQPLTVLPVSVLAFCGAFFRVPCPWRPADDPVSDWRAPAFSAGAPWVYRPVLEFFGAVLDEKKRDRALRAETAAAAAAEAAAAAPAETEAAGAFAASAGGAGGATSASGEKAAAEGGKAAGRKSSEDHAAGALVGHLA